MRHRERLSGATSGGYEGQIGSERLHSGGSHRTS